MKTGYWMLDTGCKKIEHRALSIKHRVPSSEQGFTIIEGMLAIVILGLMAIIAIPRLVSTDMRVVHIAQHQIMADMRYARSRATANAEDYKVVFDEGFDEHGNPSYIKYSIKASDDTEIKRMDISERVNCTIDGGGDPWEIYFTRLGNADTSKGDYTGNDVIELRVGEYEEFIAVEAATGRVYEYEPGP